MVKGKASDHRRLGCYDVHPRPRFRPIAVSIPAASAHELCYAHQAIADHVTVRPELDVVPAVDYHFCDGDLESSLGKSPKDVRRYYQRQIEGYRGRSREGFVPFDARCHPIKPDDVR